MVKLLEGTVNKSALNITRAGTPNPELIPILDQLVRNCGNDEFTPVQVEDKKELERVRESLRQQLKNRGFRCAASSTTKLVNVKKKGRLTGETRTKIILYIAAYPPLEAPVEPTPNGKSKKKEMVEDE